MPVSTSTDVAESFQDFTEVFLQIGTAGVDQFNGRNKPISDANNASLRRRDPYTTMGITRTSQNGSPKGVTLTKNYSFKQYNAQQPRASGRRATPST